MSLAPRPTYLAPAGAQGLGSKLAGGLQQPRPNRISLKDDRFTLIMESGQQHPSVAPALALQVIFVGGNPHASRVFYDSDSYDPENSDAPVCWSDNGVGPSDKSSQPQSPTCAQCPKAVWGSAVSKMSGKGIPACSSRKKVAVLVAGAGSDVFLLDIPSASLKPFGGYMARIGGELHASPEEVVTEITMVNKELAFKEVMWLPQTMLEPVAQIVASDAPDMVVGAHDRPVQPRLAAPQQRPAVEYQEPVKQSTEMQPDPFAKMYPAGTATFDERNPPAPDHSAQFIDTRGYVERELPDEAVSSSVNARGAVLANAPRQFAQPLTSQQAEAVNSGQPAPSRKPRSDKGTSRKETVVGPGPIPAQTFASPTPPDPHAMGRQFGAAPAGGFISGGQPTVTAPQPQFGMVAEPQAPSTDMTDMLSKAFGLRIGQ